MNKKELYFLYWIMNKKELYFINREEINFSSRLCFLNKFVINFINNNYRIRKL